jgi:hypothetical protein
MQADMKQGFSPFILWLKPLISSSFHPSAKADGKGYEGNCQFCNLACIHLTITAKTGNLHVIDSVIVAIYYLVD